MGDYKGERKRKKRMKELQAFKVLEHSKESTIAHDDKLLLRAVKSELGLTAYYRHFVKIKRRKDGRAIIVNYIKESKNGEKTSSISVEEWEELEEIEREKYKPQYLKGLDLGDGVSIEIKNNQVDMRIYNLFDNFGSRYKKSLEGVEELERKKILRYEPRVQKSEKNKKEALRIRLKERLKPTEYEHNILISGRLGRMIYRDLERKYEKIEGGKGSKVLDGTVYLWGYKSYKRQSSKCKFYNIAEREFNKHIDKEEEETEKKYDDEWEERKELGEFFKIEMTLYKEFFKKEDMRINEITTQTKTQEKIMDKLVKLYTKAIKKFGGDTLKEMSEELKMPFKISDRKIHENIARELLRPERTLTERVEAIEKANKEMQYANKRLEREMQYANKRLEREMQYVKERLEKIENKK